MCKSEAEAAGVIMELEYALNTLIVSPNIWQILRMPFVVVDGPASGSGEWSTVIQTVVNLSGEMSG